MEDLRGTPMTVGNLEEIIDDQHAIVSTASGPEYYVSILSFVDKDELEPGSTVLLHHKVRRPRGATADGRGGKDGAPLGWRARPHLRRSSPRLQTSAVVGILEDDANPMVNVMKLDKAPKESYADIGGLEQQIQEIKVGKEGG